MTMSRRFLLGTGVFLAAPAIVRVCNIMPISTPRLVNFSIRLVVAPVQYIWVNGGHITIPLGPHSPDEIITASDGSSWVWCPKT